jgi:hypothetical protein
MTTASQGAQSRWAVEPGAAPHTFDASSEQYEFLSESIAKQGTILDTNAIRGTRSHHASVTRLGTYTVGGAVTFHPSPAALDIWLPRILGAAESTDTFALAETLPPFGMLFDRVGGVFEYADCQVNRATFRGRAGGLIELSLDILGKTEVTGTVFASAGISVASNADPYVFSDGVLTLQAASREFFDFELMIDNHLDARFANSLTATSITPQDRTVTLRVNGPFTSAELAALYNQAVAGAAGSLVFTNGGMSTTATFATLQAPARSPNVSGKSEVGMSLEMTARMSGSTREVVFTHDSAA